MNSKIRIWFTCARPKTLAASIAPVLLGGAMAFSDGEYGKFSWLTFAVTLLAAVFIQVGTNFANDYYDHLKGSDTEGRVGPIRGLHTGEVSPSQMKTAFIVAFAFAMLLGLFLVVKGGLPILLIGHVSVVCGYLYTAGPFPLAYVGLGDVFVFVFFGPVATAGTYFLQRSEINSNVVIAGLATGLLATAILAVNNFRDYDSDKAARKNTLVVRLGRSFGIYEYAFCLLAALAIPVYLAFANAHRFGGLLSLLTLPFSFCLIRRIAARPAPEVLNNLLAGTGKLLIVFSLLFALGWLIGK
jgi:1,4-dihydroxy-2-naphthoate octaprenyltransferase